MSDALYPSARNISLKARRFIDHLIASFGDEPPWGIERLSDREGQASEPVMRYVGISISIHCRRARRRSQRDEALDRVRIRPGSSLFEPVKKLHAGNSTKPEVTDVDDRQFQVFDEIA